ncbi:MAG: hypothetical protein QF492_07610, partial [Candidatus Krumholzibacteria bacterium]|nr:hypothetical protein [Candidatus Krumholzibacteria bacterium]
GLSAADLEARVSELLDEMGEDTFLFTDYFGGSCASACLENARRRKNLPVVSGVNLPMLLYFLSHRKEMEARDLLKGLLNRGQNAIRELEPPSL